MTRSIGTGGIYGMRGSAATTASPSPEPVVTVRPPARERRSTRQMVPSKETLAKALPSVRPPAPPAALQPAPVLESTLRVATGLPSTPATPHHVLVVEDDRDQAVLLVRWLERRGKRVTLVRSRTEALQAVEAPFYDIVVCDLQLPDGSGLDVAKQSKQHWPQRPCVIATAKGDMDHVVEALRSRVDEFLTKPLDLDELVKRLDDLLQPIATESVLAIGAHPDDVEIGIGGILERHRRAGDRIMVLACSDGGDALGRVREAHAAAQHLRAVLQIGDLPSAAIDDGQETIALIEAAIGKCQPTTIYTHSVHDMNQDHRAVHRATLAAAGGAPNVFCYQSPTSTTEFRPSHFVDIGETLDAKLELIAYHESQVGRPEADPEMVRSTARYWGRYVGHGNAEPLEVIRSTE